LPSKQQHCSNTPSDNQQSFPQASIGFLLAYAVPTVVVASIFLARTTDYPNACTFLPLLIAYGLVPLVNLLWQRLAAKTPGREGDDESRECYYRATLLLGVPVQLAVLYIAGDLWNSGLLDNFGRIGLLLSTGIYGAIFGIVIAHELIHRDSGFERFLGGLLLSTVSFGSFRIVHLVVHHRYVATPLDFATAKRGQTIYRYWVQCFVGHIREALLFERSRLAAAKKPLWMNELVIWYGFSLLWLIGATLLWGSMGAIFFLGQSLLAIMKFDCINYLQHYGLLRKVSADGRFEPVQAQHAWAQNFALDDLILLNLPRHGNHHVHPQRAYYLLESEAVSPGYPYNYAVMTLLLLVPPLFRYVVHPRLDRFTGTATIQRHHNLWYQVGLIGFTGTRSLLRHVKFLIDVHPRYALRLLLVVATSLCGLPLRVWETIRFSGMISRVSIDNSPIFIIGHWRSGTTHLHYLMSQDPALGYLTMYQAMVPNCSLAGEDWLKRLLARIVPLKRPMDNMVWPIDAAQEEEIPLAKITPYSFYTRFLFPRKSHELFRKYVLLEGAEPEVAAELKRTYYRLVQVATLHAHGRRLVLKNPVNTARLRLLLELFPNAKFIHIYRRPYDVYASTLNLYHELLAITTLENVYMENAGETILSVYEAMMRRFFAERTMIPEGNLVEIRFEELERDPIGQLAHIYRSLNLPGYREAEAAFLAYIRSQNSYRKNRLVLSPEDRARIEHRWAFAFETLGYPVEGLPEQGASLQMIS
jgi:hypothetical protein